MVFEDAIEPAVMDARGSVDVDTFACDELRVETLIDESVPLAVGLLARLASSAWRISVRPEKLAPVKSVA